MKSIRTFALGFVSLLLFCSGAMATCPAGYTCVAAPFQFTPQGRLTLTTGKPVMSADVTAATTLYYDTYAGNQVPVWNGTSMIGLTITSDEVSMGLSTTNHPASGVFDVFAVNNSSALALCTVAWTNGTTRASAISLQSGVWTITAAPTHCYGGVAGATDLASAIGGAHQATLLGSMATTSTNGQTAMQFLPAGASGGPSGGAWRGIGNVYNKVTAPSQAFDSMTSYTIASTSYAALDASNNNRVSYIDPLGQYQPMASVHASYTTGTLGYAKIAACLNATTCTPVAADATVGLNNTGITPVAWSAPLPGTLGFNFIQGVELYAVSAGTGFNNSTAAELPY